MAWQGIDGWMDDATRTRAATVLRQGKETDGLIYSPEAALVDEGLGAWGVGAGDEVQRLADDRPPEAAGRELRLRLHRPPSRPRHGR